MRSLPFLAALSLLATLAACASREPRPTTVIITHSAQAPSAHLPLPPADPIVTYAPQTLTPIAPPTAPSAPTPPSIENAPTLSASQLDSLVGPIALYPDPLIAQVLPASTFPIEIVQAARFVRVNATDEQIDAQPWDPSVKAVARYRTVIERLDADIEWTQRLGEAFLDQGPDVMDSIQRLRRQARNLGNLKSTDQHLILDEVDAVRILPADPQIVYIPVYEPAIVYHQCVTYPVFTWSIGYRCGLWLDLDCDWNRRWCYRPGWSWHHWHNHIHHHRGHITHFDRPTYHHDSRDSWCRDSAKPTAFSGRRLARHDSHDADRSPRLHDGRSHADRNPARPTTPAVTPVTPAAPPTGETSRPANPRPNTEYTGRKPSSTPLAETTRRTPSRTPTTLEPTIKRDEPIADKPAIEPTRATPRPNSEYTSRRSTHPKPREITTIKPATPVPSDVDTTPTVKPDAAPPSRSAPRSSTPAASKPAPSKPTATRSAPRTREATPEPRRAAPSPAKPSDDKAESPRAQRTTNPEYRSTPKPAQRAATPKRSRGN